MRIVILSAAALLLTAGLASASGLVVQQHDWANVYGLVQAGSQAGPVRVEQSGRSNIVGIVQAVPNAATTVLQNGRSNRAFIGQFAPFSALLP